MRKQPAAVDSKHYTLASFTGQLYWGGAGCGRKDVLPRPNTRPGLAGTDRDKPGQKSSLMMNCYEINPLNGHL